MERGIREGMVVHSSDGERLGKVIALEAEGFLVEKGIFFPKEYFCRYELVASIDGDDVRLASAKDQLTGEGDRRPEGLAAAETGAAGAGLYAGQATEQARGQEEIRMTAAEEELEAVKRQREAGEVRLRKEVVTETKQIDVPVTREEVRVERTPVDAPRAAGTGEARFQEESVSMPIREEEVEIRKRPVVKEEVRLRREQVQGEQRADAEVRREEVHVEGEETKGRDPGTTGTPGGLGAPGAIDDDLR